MPLSHTHFIKLCECFASTPGSASRLISYNGFLSSLGVPLSEATNTSISYGESCHTESLQVGPETCNILGIVFKRMRSRLEQRHTSLTDRIQAIIHTSYAENLSEADVRKILEDSWIILDDKNFKQFTERTGFVDGCIERSVFQEKYEEATARGGQQGSEGGDPLLITAEHCLAALKTRIKLIHGNNLTAFQFMDRKCKGMVDRHDFKVLYDSLGFLCTKGEYEQLLDLIGLHPGGNLNYAEFIHVIENNDKNSFKLLAHEAHYKWADMSKVLLHFDTNGQDWIYKKSLRKLLFTYALPLRPDEFEQLWLRYDPEGRGCVAVCDFLEKLGFHHQREVRSQRHKQNQTVAQVDADRAVPYAGTSLEHIQLKVSIDDNCKRLSYIDFLSAFDQSEEKCEPPPASPDAMRQIESLECLSPGMALARMRELVAASAPNLYKAFSAFDQGRTGMVKTLEFRQVLENFCAHTSDKEYRYMLSNLELDCENSAVNWKDFLNKFQSHSPLFESVWHQNPMTEQEKQQFLKCSGALGRTTDTETEDPTNNIPSPSPEPRGIVSASKPCCPNTSSLQCTSRHLASAGRPETGSPLGSMERRVRGAVQRCWKEIQKNCAEKDPQQKGHISTASFLEILQSININTTQDQLKHLAVKFDFMNNDCVSYHNFLRHFLLNLKPAEAKWTYECRRLPLPITPTSQGVLSQDCVEVMLRAYDVVRSSCTSIRRRFLMSDHARTGSVSVQDFRKVLCHFGVNLSEEEFFHLSSYFDAHTTGKICYNNFLWVFLH